MKSSQTKINRSISLETIVGIVLLIPPIIGVFLFLINLLVLDSGKISEMGNLSNQWTGDYGFAGEGGGGGGYTSAAPIYLGLMAIAGAILLKNGDKKAQHMDTSKDSN
jgi:hypothetical protein